MQMRAHAKRWKVVLVLALAATGCVIPPPALERELECPAAGAPNHYGDTQSCPPPPHS